MPVKRRRLIFQLSAQEKKNKFKGVLTRALQQAAAMNVPFVYRNELCIQPNHFIHKYPNGRMLLIEQDVRNSEEKTVRVLR
jgi:hypothetical protein